MKYHWVQHNLGSDCLTGPQVMRSARFEIYLQVKHASPFVYRLIIISWRRPLWWIWEWAYTPEPIYRGIQYGPTLGYRLQVIRVCIPKRVSGSISQKYYFSRHERMSWVVICQLQYYIVYCILKGSCSVQSELYCWGSTCQFGWQRARL